VLLCHRGASISALPSSLEGTPLRSSITIREVELDRDFPAIIGLYRAHGWSHARNPERLYAAVEHSAYAVVAVESERIIGFARALSDEAFAVYIADILVAPERQREGIGRALTEAIQDHYPLETFHHQVLIAERGVEGFYERLGMTPVAAFGLTAFIRTHGR
jgi:GNAT superfamily N-acetyltransferase